MDKSWMTLENRALPGYESGVQQFFKFAYSSIEPWKKIRCLCKKCNNVYFQSRDDVEADLFECGILQSYVTWVLHGEKFDDSGDEEFNIDEQESQQLELDEATENDTQGHHNDHDGMQDMLEDCYAAATINTWSGDESKRNENAVPNWESDKFKGLLKYADKKLYPGCEQFTMLSFVVILMHLKILNRWTNKSFSMLLEVLKKALPNVETLHCSYYEAKKIIQDLGLDYEKIHACVNDCVLFRKDYENKEECPKCLAPRYKFAEVEGGETHKKIPQKILRYFPLKLRLRRLYISKKTAQDMRWHKEKRTNDGVLRHPADAQEWKEFDDIHKSFSKNPRNVRLGLATDGFNPFLNMSLSHNTWLVILLPYNLPPWKSLKAPFFHSFNAYSRSKISRT